MAVLLTAKVGQVTTPMLRLMPKRTQLSTGLQRVKVIQTLTEMMSTTQMQTQMQMQTQTVATT